MAAFTYPQMVWRDGNKKLWNSIQRKPLKIRPEERVRLRIIEALLLAGWSKYRISTEEAVDKGGQSGLRTDIICYNQQFEPRLLVECKAEHVPISDRTAEQLARYNQKVKAPYLLMTNGVADFWYRIRGETIDQLSEPPEMFTLDEPTPDYGLEDWQQRGFAGTKASPGLRKWFSAFLPKLWHQQKPSHIRFLNFNQVLTDLLLDHYYCIHRAEGHRRLALTTLTTAYGGSRLVVILNENNQNSAVLEVNLDLLFEDRSENSTLYSSADPQTINFARYGPIPDTNQPETVLEQADRIFKEHVA